MIPIPRPEDVDLVIYHASCADGFTAAWAIWKLVGDQAEYIHQHYGDDPPDVQGKNVAIVDFCFPRKVLEEMLKKAKSLVVLDHHKTAMKDLELSTRTFATLGEDKEFDLTIEEERHELLRELEFPKMVKLLKIEAREIEAFPNAVFDMCRSGALITWEWFHPGKPVPSLIQHVSDRDLWTFTLEDTRTVHAALGLIDFDFQQWDEVAKKLEGEGRGEFLTMGRIVLSHVDKICESAAKKAELIVFEGIRMWTTNYTGRYNSDVAQFLRNRETEDGEVPGVSMTWFYDQEGDVFRCSLRSRDDREDVGAIAKKYGGGGHRNAAGFEWKDDIRTLVRSR